MQPHYEVHKILTEEQECSLTNYIKMCHSLSTIAMQQLAFKMAEKNGIDTLAPQKSSKCAELEQMGGFLHYNRISIRKLDACSLLINIFYQTLCEDIL
jgi:hypothetical protein